MSASYEQRKAAVADALWDNGLCGQGWCTWAEVERLAEAALAALDHIPEKVDWVSHGYTRDTT